MRRNKIFNKSAFSMLVAIILVACSSGGSCASGGSSSTPPVLTDSDVITFDALQSIPLRNGDNTPIGIYIHNNSTRQISGIQISSENNFTSVNMLKTSDQCADIPANGSCFVEFNRPQSSDGLPLRGSIRLTVNYNYNNHRLTTEKIINLSQIINGYSPAVYDPGVVTINYSTAAQEYALVYNFLGGSPDDLFLGSNFSFGDSGIKLTTATPFYKNFSGNGLLPLEYQIRNSNIRKTETASFSMEMNKAVRILGYNEIRVLSAGSAGSLFLSYAPTINLADFTTGKTYAYNLGAESITIGSIAPQSNNISIDSLAAGACVTGMVLAPNKSCLISYSVNNPELQVGYYRVDYTTGLSQKQSRTGAVVWLNVSSGTNSPLLGIDNDNQQIQLDGTKPSSVKIVLSNNSHQVFNNLFALPAVTSSSNIIVSQINNGNCPEQLAAESSCYFTANISQLKNGGPGDVYIPFETHSSEAENNTYQAIFHAEIIN